MPSKKELNHMAGHDDFIQISSGHVVKQFDLSAAGAAIAAKIIEATRFRRSFGRFYLRVLQNGAPYKAWPAEARAAIGADTRTMKVTFYYD